MIKSLWLIFAAVDIIFAEHLLITSQQSCGKEYSLDNIKSIYLSYEGDHLGSEPCATRFDLVDRSDYTICVKPVELQLDCSTTIEYQDHFVAENINDGELTCTMNKQSTFDETCKSFLDTFFIVIKKEDPNRNSFESAKIHVYAKERENYVSTTNYVIVLSCLVPVIIIVCIVCGVICIQRKRRQQPCNTQVTYQTAVGATTIPTGGYVANTNTYPGTVPCQQPLLPQPGNHPHVNQADPTSRGQSLVGYYVHPTVTSYPAQNQQTPGQYNYQPAPQGYQPAPQGYQPAPQVQFRGMQTTPEPTAPPQEASSSDLGPPSYESLMKK